MMTLILALMVYISPIPQSEQGCTNMPESYAVWCNDGDVYNGYWWNEWWIPRMVTEEEWYLPAPTVSSGRAVWYAPGVMEANIWLRWEWGQIPRPPSDYIDGVAMMSPADIGQTVWILHPGGTWEGPFVVVDCAQRDDIWPIIQTRQEVVEVSWETAQRWGMTDPLDGVVVVKAEDPLQLFRRLEWEEPVDYPAWWLKTNHLVKETP
jgi:hypothetical protein